MGYLRFARGVLAAALASLFLTQCGSTSPPFTPAPTPITLAQVPQAKEIRIHRIEEYGISLTPWINASYDLQPGPAYFRGRAEFRVQSMRELYPLVATEDLSIPRDVMDDFLQRVARIRLEEGEYRPPVFCTDCDKLSFDIEFVLESESISLSMETPDREETQWVATIKGRTYLINTNAPMEALELLRPYLKEDVLARLTQEAKGP